MSIDPLSSLSGVQLVIDEGIDKNHHVPKRGTRNHKLYCTLHPPLWPPHPPQYHIIRLEQTTRIDLVWDSPSKTVIARTQLAGSTHKAPRSSVSVAAHPHTNHPSSINELGRRQPKISNDQI
ncbi:hypothetical protein AVEN_237960-1 [Araneus ventricosus]|uniref:Uncharacterized protein n=1 Tax=Araneus ventricosus TaxID=182803 RepID=A0A4Y2E417_ARAVE|nr:hypothetical protein AVEN_237960-1 [Araneus ventricosus]